MLGASVHRGREEVLRHFAEFEDAPGKLEIDREEIIASNDNLVVAVLHLVGTARSSGVPLELSITHVYSLDSDLRAVEVHTYLDPRRPLKQWGCGSRARPNGSGEPNHYE
jgi:hypothetical protein